MPPRRRVARSEAPFPGRVLPREQWTRTRVGLGERGKLFDWEQAFGRRAPRVLDLGCGNGRYLIAAGIARPERDHLGVELVPPAVKFASLRAGQRGSTNVKFAWGDASEFVLERCAAESIDEIHLHHPQPYYDRSKVERRQLTPKILRAIWRALVPGGWFVFQTDNPAYWRWTREHSPRLFDWAEIEGAWPDLPEARTTRELVALSHGLQIFRARGRKLALDEDELERRVASIPEPTFDANKPGFGAERPRRRERRR